MLTELMLKPRSIVINGAANALISGAANAAGAMR